MKLRSQTLKALQSAINALAIVESNIQSAVCSVEQMSGRHDISSQLVEHTHCRRFSIYFTILLTDEQSISYNNLQVSCSFS